jgi:hypothetical protein
MRTAMAVIFATLATLFVFATTSRADPDKDNLTGRWTCDDGGTYYIRQIGNELWWTGKSGEPKGQKKAFANIFHGTINGNEITGSWADDPAGEARGSGKMTLEIIGEGKKVELRRKGEANDFGGATWTPHRK